MGEVLKISQERQDALIKQGEKLAKGLRHVDNWQNALTGLGTSIDKAQHTFFQAKARIPDQDLCNLFHGDDITRRVVTIYPQEMTRKGFRVGLPKKFDVDQNQLAQEMVRLEVVHKFFEGLTWGRLYGGAVAVLGINDGRQPDQPVNEEAIKSVDFINIIDKRYLQPIEWQNDPFEPNFGEPVTYNITPQTVNGTSTIGIVKVHRSRLIIFPGVLTSVDKQQNNDGWDMSLLQTLRPVIRDFQSNWNAVGNLVQEASVGVYKIKDLIGLLASGEQETLLKRLQMIDMAKSVARSVAIDADTEEYTRIGAQLSELAALLDRYMLRLAAAVEVPVTILMGQSPAGMNATGESDFRWFYDNVATRQTNDLTPLLNQLLRYIFLAQEGPTKGTVPDVWEIDYFPLWATTPKEQAEVEKLTAERDNIYITAKVLDEDEVALNRFTDEGWRQETKINRELREERLKVKTKQAEELLKNPPEPPPAPPQGGDPESDEVEEEEESAGDTPGEEEPKTPDAPPADPNVTEEEEQ